ERNLHIGVLTTLFGEDFDTEVVILVGSMFVVIAGHLEIEDDGGRSRSERLARHLEFVGRNGLKALRANCTWEVVTDGQNQRSSAARNKAYSTKWHGSAPERSHSPERAPCTSWCGQRYRGMTSESIAFLAGRASRFRGQA